jgi:GH25 family lysozyme M1 (1,4-beta-N-acetylmuramidase)
MHRPRTWISVAVGAAVAATIAIVVIGPASAGPTPVLMPATQAATAPPAMAAPLAVAPAGYPTTGIDVSAWQGTVDWGKVVTTGNTFVYVKATEGETYLSDTFVSQYTGAKAAGLYVGAYTFARPDDSAVKTADYFLSQSRYESDGQTLPPMLDIEWPYSTNGKFVAPYPCYGLTPAAMVAWIQAFVTEIKRLTGSVTMIYTAPNWWNTCTDSSSAFADEPLDVGSYAATPVLPGGWTTWTIWQYATTGAAPGDQNVFNGSITSLATFTKRRCKWTTCVGYFGTGSTMRNLRR